MYTSLDRSELTMNTNTSDNNMPLVSSEDHHNTTNTNNITTTGTSAIQDNSQDPYFLERLSHLYHQSMSSTNKLAHHNNTRRSNKNICTIGIHLRIQL